MDGAIVIDKPEGWTSHDVVNKIRRLANTRKVGHLGTLDPMATGVLPLVLNRATRLAQFYTRSDKVYEGVIRFGFSTDTYDRMGSATSPVTEPAVGRSELEAAIERFRGVIQQVPPAVSAKKVDGKRAYELARKKLPVELKPVEVTIHSFELLEYSGGEARVRVHCSAGTYLRSIAHDLGKEFGCGAHLKDLRRLAAGHFTLEDAHTLAELEELAGAGRFDEAVIPGARLLPEFPVEHIDTIAAAQIRQGRDFRTSPFRTEPPARLVKAVTREGCLIAIGEATLPHVYHPILVL
jgi:tRNA pseudouridine55 synthase